MYKVLYSYRTVEYNIVIDQGANEAPNKVHDEAESEETFMPSWYSAFGEMTKIPFQLPTFRQWKLQASHVSWSDSQDDQHLFSIAEVTVSSSEPMRMLIEDAC